MITQKKQYLGKGWQIQAQSALQGMLQNPVYLLIALSPLLLLLVNTTLLKYSVLPAVIPLFWCCQRCSAMNTRLTLLRQESLSQTLSLRKVGPRYFFQTRQQIANQMDRCKNECTASLASVVLMTAVFTTVGLAIAPR